MVRVRSGSGGNLGGRARKIALHSLGREPTALDETVEGHRVFAIGSHRVVLLHDAFHPVLTCAECGTEFVGYQRIRVPTDLGSAPSPCLCAGCGEARWLELDASSAEAPAASTSGGAELAAREGHRADGGGLSAPPIAAEAASDGPRRPGPLSVAMPSQAQPSQAQPAQADPAGDRPSPPVAAAASDAPKAVDLRGQLGPVMVAAMEAAARETEEAVAQSERRVMAALDDLRREVAEALASRPEPSPADGDGRSLGDRLAALEAAVDAQAEQVTEAVKTALSADFGELARRVTDDNLHLRRELAGLFDEANVWFVQVRDDLLARLDAALHPGAPRSVGPSGPSAEVRRFEVRGGADLAALRAEGD